MLQWYSSGDRRVMWASCGGISLVLDEADSFGQRLVSYGEHSLGFAETRTQAEALLSEYAARIAEALGDV